MKNLLFVTVIFILFSCSNKKEGSGAEIGYELARDFPVPCDRLYAALTDSVILKKVWGVQTLKMDVRYGGQTKATYWVGDQNWSFSIYYKEVMPNRRLRWVTKFDNYPTKEWHTLVLINRIISGSELVVRTNNFETPEERDANREAWKKGLETLKEMLKQ